MRPLWFLLTRPPVMVMTVLGTLGWLLFFFTNAKVVARLDAEGAALLVGISLLCGGGIAALTVGPAFMLWRLRTPAPDVPLDEGEVVRYSVPANHERQGEMRGGKLRITDRRVLFIPHRFNVSLETVSIPLSLMRGLHGAGTSLTIALPNHVEHVFLVDAADYVASQIEGTLSTP